MKPLPSKRILVAIGLLVFIPIWTLILAPLRLQIPADFSFTADIVSVDNFLDPNNNTYSGAIFSQTEYSYQAISRENGVLIIKNRFSVKSPEGGKIFEVERLYGIDPLSGKHVPGYGDKDRTGYLFAPKHLRSGQSFTYWHVNYDAPAEMVYLAEEEVQGLTTFKYHSRYNGQAIDQTKELGYLPKVGETLGIEVEPLLQLWVEPVTGKLIKYQDDSTAYYYDLKTGERLQPWNHFTNTFATHSVEANVDGMHVERIRTLMVDIYFPIIFLIVAILLLAQRKDWSQVLQKKVSSKAVYLAGSGLVILIGVLALLSWIIGIEEVVKILPEQRAMNPMTAVSFLLLGVMLLLQDRYKGRVSVGLGIIVSSIGLLNLLNTIDAITFEVDLLLFRDTITTGSVLGRMSQFTSICLVFLGLVPLTRKVEILRRSRLAELFSSVVIVFSLIALTGLVLDIKRLLVVQLFSALSFGTLISFVVVSVIVYFFYRERDNETLGFRSWSLVTGIIFLSGVATITLAAGVDIVITNEARALFSDEVEHTTEAIEGRVRVYASILEGARGLLASSQEVTRDEWRTYVKALATQENYPGIQGIGYTIFIKPSQLQQHIQQIRAEGLTNYTVRPPGERDIYSSIIYLEPFDLRNQQAIGFDMFQEPNRKTPMEQARDTGKPKLSGKITLVQEIDEDVQPGFLMYVPVYRKGETSDTVSERRANILGYTYSPFRARNFVEGIIGTEGVDGISIKISDGPAGSADSILYDDYNKKMPGNTEPRFEEVKTIYLYGRPWILTFSALPNFGRTPFSLVAVPLVILVGVVIGNLTALAFYSLVSSRQRAIQYADQVTEDLRSAKAKDDAILLSIGDGLVATDPEGRITFTNQAFENILGLSESDVAGKKLVDVVPMLDKDGKEVPELERLLTKVLWHKMPGTTSADYLYQRKDGSTFPVTITVSPIILNEEVIGIVEVFRDITKEKDVDRAKTEFVSLASHQLRTPLSSINWYSEMLLNGDAGEITPSQQEFLNEIFTNNHRMINLVDTLLNVSRLEMGTFVINPRRVDLAELIYSVIKELKPHIQQQQLQVSLQLDEKIGVIQADPGLLRMVLQNLISNGVKYSPEKGKLTIRLENSAGGIQVSVSDEGLGIPKEQQRRIFSKLFRADNARERDSEGTGLGLYIAKSIIERSGGKIWFESEENKGSTFYFSLPETGMLKKDGTAELR